MIVGRRAASAAGGSFFIDFETASAWRRTRRILPPASLARFSIRPAAADQLGEQSWDNPATLVRPVGVHRECRRGRRQSRHGHSRRPWRHARHGRRLARQSRWAPDAPATQASIAASISAWLAGVASGRRALSPRRGRPTISRSPRSHKSGSEVDHHDAAIRGRARWSTASLTLRG